MQKINKNTAVYISTLLHIVLFALAITMFVSKSSGVEIISITPPLGISFVFNGISLFFVALFTFLMMMFSLFYLSYRKENAYKDESKFLILINMLLASSIGLVLSSDIFNIYVFFEIAGISAYILSAYTKTAQALEAGLKYLITGAMASIFLLFGIFLIYINLGSLNLGVISEGFSSLPINLQVLISILLLLGFGFKVEIFPLNFWVVDVYQGSTTLVNSLFSAIVVKAYLFVFFHLIYLFLAEGAFTHFLIYLGVISMLVAEIVALRQTNLKRLFAYSSLGQVGFIFSILALQNMGAIEAGIFIVLAHSLAKMLIFFILVLIEREYKSVEIEVLEKVDSPFIKFTMILSMLSILGIPLLAGFVGKFLALKSFAASDYFLLIALILIASLIEAVYYFKIAAALLSQNKTSKEASSGVKVLSLERLVLVTLSVLIIVVGINPLLFSDYFPQAANSMLDTQTYNTLLGVIK